MPKYVSNIQDEVGNIIIDLQTAADPNKISRVGAEQLIGDMVHRIFYEGKAANNSAIGQYSKEPIYVSLTAFVRKKGKVGKSEHGKPIKGQRALQPKGKNNDGTKFKNGKTRKSRYFEDGYLEYHDEMGNGQKVNLTLTGRLSNDLLMSKRGKYFGVGFSDYGMEIYPGLESHFNVVIFMASKEEADRVVIAVEDWIARNLKI